MQWWVISVASSTNPNGKFIVVSGTAAAIHAKYGVAASGPYPTQAAAQAQANTIGGGFPGANVSGNPGTAIGQGVSAIGNSLGLNWEQAILRFGEVALGIVLLAIGLNAVLKNPAGTVAKNVPKVVPV